MHVGASFHAYAIVYAMFVFDVLEQAGREQQGLTTHQGVGDTQRSGRSTTVEVVQQVSETPCGQRVALSAAVETTKTLTVVQSVLHYAVSKFVVRCDS